jgi:hypothetical protein
MSPTHPMPEMLKALTDDFVSTARHLLETEGHLKAIATIGHEKEVIVIQMEDIGDKDTAASYIRKVAAGFNATFIFIINEAWMLDAKHASHYGSIIDRYGSIGGSPYGIECVFFQLETHDGTWSSYVPQKPLGLSKKKKTFGEVKFELFDAGEGRHTAGRFSWLLPQKKTPGTAKH